MIFSSVFLVKKTSMAPVFQALFLFVFFFLFKYDFILEGGNFPSDTKTKGVSNQ